MEIAAQIKSVLMQIQERDRRKRPSWGLITRLLKEYPQAGNGRPWGNGSSSEGRRRKAKLFERGTKCQEKK